MRWVWLIIISLMFGSVAEAGQRRGASKGLRTVAMAKNKAMPALRVFTIGGEPFGETEIVDARALPDVTGKVTIMLTFDEKGRVKLARLSSENKSKPLAFVLDSRLLMAPVVTMPIVDGIAQITGMFSLAEAEMIAKKISGKPPLPDSLDEGL